MATSLPHFTSSEFVKKWLASTQPEPGAGMHPDSKESRQPKRKRADGPHKDDRAPATYATHPLEQHKRLISSRVRSPKRKNALFIEGKKYSDDNDAEESSEVSLSGSAKDVHVERQTFTDIRTLKSAIEDPSKKYARRPRHKTKTDRYEYKGDVEKSSVRKAARRKHQRSRRKKTGDIINQDFRAPNIEQERLTLRANTGPGIFGKRKTSALFQMRGLPDLTFSEMTFLTKKRQPERPRLDQHKSSKPAKKKERSKEISEFFANSSTEAALPRRTSSDVYHHHRSMDIRETSRSPMCSSPLKWARRRETSSSSKYLSWTSRHTERGNRVNRPDENDMTNEARSVGKRKGHGNPAVESAKLPNRESKPYYSWSTTKSWPSTTQRLTESPRQAWDQMVAHPSTQQPILTRLRQSSVTNSSLDCYTKHLLLAADHEFLQKSHRESLGSNVFSLDDLKGLARIAEIEDKYEGTIPMESTGPNLEHVMHKQDTFPRIESRPGKHQDHVTWQPSHDLAPTAPFPKRESNKGDDTSGPLSIPLAYQNHMEEHPSVTSQHKSTNTRYPAYVSGPLLFQARELIRSAKPSTIQITDTAQTQRIPYNGPYDILESQHHLTHPLYEATSQYDANINVTSDKQSHDIFNDRSIHLMQENHDARSVYDSEMLLFRDEVDPISDWGVLDNANLQSDIPELQGFQEADIPDQYDDAYGNKHNPAQDDNNIENYMHSISHPEDDFRQHDILQRRESTWRQDPSTYMGEAEEEVFEGFSRPQVLY